MNIQNILNFYKTKFDVILDSSEYYDLELVKTDDDYDSDLLDLTTPIEYSTLIFDSTECLREEIFFYTVDTSLEDPARADFGEMEMKFNSVSGSFPYTEEEIGNISVKPGGGTPELYSDLPFPQLVPSDENGRICYAYDPLNCDNVVTYSGDSQYDVIFYSTGTKTIESAYYLKLVDLNIVRTLNLTGFTNLSQLYLEELNITELKLFNSIHEEWGIYAELTRLHNLIEIDSSVMDIPTGVTLHIDIFDCESLTTIKLPNSGDVEHLTIYDNDVLTGMTGEGNIRVLTLAEIYNCPQLQEISGFSGDEPLSTLNLSNVPSLGYFDVTNFPNLTNISGSSIFDARYYKFRNNNYTTAIVNRMLYDLDSISIAGYDFRYIQIDGNSPPDSSSGGYDGLAAKASLISKGFNVTTD